MIDQIPTHRSGRYCEKMLPALPVAILGAYHPEVDLVDQLRGLQRVPLPLTLHHMMRQTAQMWHDECEEIVFGRTAASLPLMQQ